MSIENKLSYLNETKEQIKTALHAPNDIFREYPTLIEKYVKNQPKSIVEGEQAICENAIDLPCNVDINGNAYQETTEGYNLLPYPYSDTAVSLNGLTISSNNNGTLLLNGTSTGTVNFYFRRGSDSWELEKGKYTFSINNNHNKITRIVGGNTSNIAYTYSTQDNMEFEVVNGGSVENSVVIQIGSGVTFNNTILEPMIRKTTVTDTTYEPYTNGASPNTEYKQDIEVIDTVNLFDGELELGNLVNGVNEAHADVFRSKNYIKIKPNMAYAFSLNGKPNRVIISMYDKDKNYIGLDEVGLADENGLFTTYANAEYLRFRTYGADKTLFETGKIQLNEGDLKPYLPYGHIGLVQRGKNLAKSFYEGDTTRYYDCLYVDFDVKPSTTYKVSGKATAKNAYYLDITNNSIIAKYNSITVKDDGTFTMTLTTKDVFTGTEYRANKGYVIFKNDKDNSTHNFTDIQIEENTVVTEFEPYIEPKTIEIDLAGHSIAKVTLKDNLLIGIDGTVKNNKATKEYILTGEESNIVENSATKGLFQITLNNISTDLTTLRAKSNYLRGTAGQYIAQTGVDNCVSTYSGNRIFFRVNEFANNLQGFKNWLKEKHNEGKPVKVLYELANPETINLPSIEPIELFKGTNVFELVTNLGTTMKVEYILNAEKVGG